MMNNTLIRSEPCPECGADMLWTQNAWRSGDTASAAYQCAHGHVIDPGLSAPIVDCTTRHASVCQTANNSTDVCAATEPLRRLAEYCYVHSLGANRGVLEIDRLELIR